MSGHEHDRLSPYLDGELSAEATTQVATHLESCAACRRELALLRLADAAAAELPAEPPAGYFDDFPARVAARIAAQDRGEGEAARRGFVLPAWSWAAAAALLLAVLTPLTLRETPPVGGSASPGARPDSTSRATAAVPGTQRPLETASRQAAPASPATEPAVSSREPAGPGDKAANRDERAGSTALAGKTSGAGGMEQPAKVAEAARSELPRPPAPPAPAAPAQPDEIAKGRDVGLAGYPSGDTVDRLRPQAAGTGTSRSPAPTPAAQPQREGSSGAAVALEEEKVEAARGRAENRPANRLDAGGGEERQKKVRAGSAPALTDFAAAGIAADASGAEEQFRSLATRTPRGAAQWRALRDDWLALARAQGGASALGDEATVRAIAAGLEVARLGVDADDEAAFREAARAYLASPDARQKSRVRALLAAAASLR